jgi:hypothetical protein
MSTEGGANSFATGNNLNVNSEHTNNYIYGGLGYQNDM